jgi:hypothetical protein
MGSITKPGVSPDGDDETRWRCTVSSFAGRILNTRGVMEKETRQRLGNIIFRSLRWPRNP